LNTSTQIFYNIAQRAWLFKNTFFTLLFKYFIIYDVLWYYVFWLITKSKIVHFVKWIKIICTESFKWIAIEIFLYTYLCKTRNYKFLDVNNVFIRSHNHCTLVLFNMINLFSINNEIITTLMRCNEVAILNDFCFIKISLH